MQCIQILTESAAPLSMADDVALVVALLSAGLPRAYFSGWRRTMYILGMKRQKRLTVALRITHMQRLEI